MNIYRKLFEANAIDVQNRIADLTLTNKPFRHLVLQNVFHDEILGCLRESFDHSIFTCMQGGEPVHNITETSNDSLKLFTQVFLGQGILPTLDNLFRSDKKSDELRAYGVKFDVLESGNIKNNFLAVHQPGSSIPIHRDDYWMTYQIVFYLGYVDGSLAPTTKLHFSSEESVGDNEPPVSFPDMSNGMLVFESTPNSFHSMMTPLKNRRLSINTTVSLHKEL